MIEGIDRDSDDVKGEPVESATPLEHVICTEKKGRMGISLV